MKYKVALIVLFSGLFLTNCSKKDKSIVEPSQPSGPVHNLIGTWSANSDCFIRNRLRYPGATKPIVLYITYQGNDTVKGYGMIGDSLHSAPQDLPYMSFTHIGIIQNDSLIDYLYPTESLNITLNILTYKAQISDSSLQGGFWLIGSNDDVGIGNVTFNR